MGNLLARVEKEAAEKTRKSLEMLIRKPLKLSFNCLEVKENHTLPYVENEELVGAVFCPVKGDLEGGNVFIVAEEDLYKMANFLSRRPLESTLDLSPLDESALGEVGNILSGNYCAILADELDLTIIHQVPYFVHTMYGAVQEQMLLNFGERQDDGMLFELIFEIVEEGISLKTFFLAIFDKNVITQAVNAKAGTTH